MGTQVGTAGGGRALRNPVVGTSAGNKPVSKIFAGTAAGNKVVWQRSVMATTASATPVSANGIDVSWTATPGAVYTLFRRRAGTPGEVGLVANTSALAYSDRGLDAGATYSYYVNVVINGVLVGQSNFATAATPAAQYAQRFVELEAVASASYNGALQNRNVAECYYGYYSASQGRQRSLWWWDIPAEVRGCVSVDRIDVRVYNLHAWAGSGGSVGLVVHDGDYRSGAPSGQPNTTGLLRHNGAEWLVGTPKPGFLSQDGSGWMTNIQVLSSAGRTTLAEEFRVNGIWGIGLAAPNDSLDHYGYAAGATAQSGRRPAIRITYTVRTG